MQPKRKSFETDSFSFFFFFISSKQFICQRENLGILFFLCVPFGNDVVRELYQRTVNKHIRKKRGTELRLKILKEEDRNWGIPLVLLTLQIGLRYIIRKPDKYKQRERRALVKYHQLERRNTFPDFSKRDNVLRLIYDTEFTKNYVNNNIPAPLSLASINTTVKDDFLVGFWLFGFGPFFLNDRSGTNSMISHSFFSFVSVCFDSAIA